jgi:hypothetical protein
MGNSKTSYTQAALSRFFERPLISTSQINYRMRVTMNDGRQMTGQMLAFDKVSNPPPLYILRPY